jgi:hypothetical protein
MKTWARSDYFLGNFELLNLKIERIGNVEETERALRRMMQGRFGHNSTAKS